MGVRGKRTSTDPFALGGLNAARARTQAMNQPGPTLAQYYRKDIYDEKQKK